MQNKIFEQIEVSVPNGNNFNLSYSHKTSFTMGKLIPINLLEVLPGDNINMNIQNLVRFLPLVAPVMSKITLKINTFFVPNRIIFKNWENFITGGTDIETVIAPPTIPETNVVSGSLANYLGLPLSIVSSPTYKNLINAMPFAAYQRCWYDWYRDQNMYPMDEFPILESGTINPTDWTNFYQHLRNRAWEHDYFTSGLPFAQKGPAVMIPVQGTVTGTAPVIVDDNNNPTFWEDIVGIHPGVPGADIGTDAFSVTSNLNPAYQNVRYNPNGTLIVDGSTYHINDITTSINDLRTATALQRWLEKNARAGTRYKEHLDANFGVSPTDLRLQRADLIDSSYQNVVISEVLQNSSTDAVTPQGNMAGHAITADVNKTINYEVKEHGFIISIATVMPEASYCQGIERHFLRTNRFDYYQPDFANLGEQSIYNCELVNIHDPSNLGAFAYMPRYAEYRYKKSITTGELIPGRSLESWTQARNFDFSTPNLNREFIDCFPSTRIFAVTDADEHHLIGHFFFNINTYRKMPEFANPI